MALYRLAMRTISRGRGELAVAAAAYIAAARLYLEAEHTTFDFTWRAGDVVHSELIGAYGWTREELWNEAEWAEWEVRWDGVTGREFVIALPHELSLDGQIELARSFGRYLHHEYGVAVDVAVHVPDVSRGQDPRNRHAHILTTTRVMTPQGLGEKTAVWDHARTGGQELRRVRETWAWLQNRALERAGVEARVDARSYREQGLARLPGVHMGRRRWTLERSGTPTEAGDYNRGLVLLNRIRVATGADLDWDWTAKAKTFTDEDGHRAYQACRAQLYALAQSIEGVKADRGALAAPKRLEMRQRQQELYALLRLLRPCEHVVRQERIRERQAREQERRRRRGRGGRAGLE